METIKKTIKRELIVSGVTDTEFAIVPDLNTFYNFKILLTAQVHDIGFFDAFVEPYGYGYPEFEGFENPENHKGINEDLLLNEDFI